MTRALWHPLEVVVVDIDESIPADHRAWLRGRLGVTPRKGGITFREGASERQRQSDRRAQEGLGA